MKKLGVGVIGCGVISEIYLKNMTERFPVVDVRGVADALGEKAKLRSEQYSVPFFYTPEDLLASDEIDIVVNLTTPFGHYPVAKQALLAGKHVYSEKPMAINRLQGHELLSLAQQRGLQLGGAPDTFLGSGLQTCRRALDGGSIGNVVSAAGFFSCPGHERWHSAPAFYYESGGGPLWDMGPYYLTALVTLLGPVAKVCGHSRKTYPQRTITSEPLNGTKIPVEVPTDYSLSLELECGALATLILSFDVWATSLPKLEIYGSGGSLALPDPNTFGGPAARLPAGDNQEWENIPVSPPFDDNARGLGVADMALAILQQREARAGAALCYHVLDVMQALDEAAKRGERLRVESSCARPIAMPEDSGAMPENPGPNSGFGA